MKKYNFYFTYHLQRDYGDVCDFRLSPTSRARCEERGGEDISPIYVLKVEDGSGKELDSTFSHKDIFGNVVSVRYNSKAPKILDGGVIGYETLEAFPKEGKERVLEPIDVLDSYGNYVQSFYKVTGGEEPDFIDKTGGHIGNRSVKVEFIEKYLKDKFSISDDYSIITDGEMDLSFLLDIKEVEGFTFGKFPPKKTEEQLAQELIEFYQKELDKSLALRDKLYRVGRGLLKQPNTVEPAWRNWATATGSIGKDIEWVKKRYRYTEVSNETLKKLLNAIQEYEMGHIRYQEVEVFKIDAVAYCYLIDTSKKFIKIPVPKEYMGLAIGKGGKNIKRLKELFDNKINIVIEEQKEQR